MRNLLSALTLSTLTIQACTFQDNTTKTQSPVKLSISCENEDYEGKETQDGTQAEMFVCTFPEFKIFAYKLPGMETKEYMEKVYSWFKQSAFYGPEAYALQGIFFDGSVSGGSSYGSYSTSSKLISIYPNNIGITSENPVPKSIAQRLGEDFIDPTKDYRYWTYTISHEYNHHSSFIYSSTGQVKSSNFGGNQVHDLTITKVGEKLLSYTKITERPEFLDINKVNPIPAFKGGTPKSPWPDRIYGTSFNKYLWTKAELLARGISLYTYSVDKDLQNENSVNAFGGIIDDYWWYHYYKANIYEENKDSSKKPIQAPVDKLLNEWAEFMDNEWLNDDEELGRVFNDFDNKIYITSNSLAAKNIKLVNVDDEEDIIDFTMQDKIANLKYFWRPFDSRKARTIKYESNVFKSDKRLGDGTKYILRIKGKDVKTGFGLINKSVKKEDQKATENNEPNNQKNNYAKYFASATGEDLKVWIENNKIYFKTEDKIEE